MGQRFLRVLAMAVVLSLGCSKGYIKSYNRGVDYLGQGDEKTAMREFQSCLAENPRYAGGHYGLGKCYYALGKKKEAEKEFKEALRLNSRYADAHWALGLVLYDTGEKDKALSSLKESYSLKANPDCAYDIGVVAGDLGHYKDALTYLAAARRGKPSDAHIVENLALASEGAGKTEQAVRYWREALELERNEERRQAVKARLATLQSSARPDKWDPRIFLISPQPGTQTRDRKTKLVGIAFDDVKVERVYVSGRRIEGKPAESPPKVELPFTPGDQLFFELEVPLEAGENEILIEAYDSGGRCSREAVLVIRR